MRTRLRCALRVGLVLLASCRPRADPPAETTPRLLPPCPAPAVATVSWRRVEERGFSLSLPPDFQRVRVQGIDSHVGRFEADGGNTVVSFDLGWYSDDLHRDPEFHEAYSRCEEVIGGRPATVITAVLRNPQSPPQDGRVAAAATWRNLGGSAGAGRPQTHLTVWAEARDPGRLPTLLAILRTVRFSDTR